MKERDKLILEEQRLILLENFDKLCKANNLKDLQYFKSDLLLRLESISQMLTTYVIEKTLYDYKL